MKGYASSIDSGLMVNAFHAFNVGLRVDVFFEYVRSKANIGDLPSRLAMDELWGDVRDDRRGVEGARGRDGDAAIPRLVRAGGPVVVGWGRGGGGGGAESEACGCRRGTRYVGG